MTNMCWGSERNVCTLDDSARKFQFHNSGLHMFFSWWSQMVANAIYTSLSVCGFLMYRLDIDGGQMGGYAHASQ